MKKGDAINEASSFSSQIRSYLFMDGISCRPSKTSSGTSLTLIMPTVVKSGLTLGPLKRQYSLEVRHLYIYIPEN